MKIDIGVRCHDLINNCSVDDFILKMNEHHFKNIQLVFNKTFKDYSYDDEFVNDVSFKLDKNDIEVKMLGAYFNPVHSDRNVVLKGIDNFKKNLLISHKFKNLPYVGSETGSYNDSPWIFHPKNITEEGYQETKKVFVELKDYAESIDSKMIIESAYGHVINNIKRHARLLSELNSDNVFATIDLFNLLYEGNFDNRNEIFEEALKTLGNKIKVIHIKDAKVVDNRLVQLPVGEGEFDYGFMISCIKKYLDDVTLIFEGVKEDKIEKAKNIISALI